MENDKDILELIEWALETSRSKLTFNLPELQAGIARESRMRGVLRDCKKVINEQTQKIARLEQYINLTEKFPYQSKTDEELKALYSSAIESRDWFTCDLISTEQQRRKELLNENI